LSLDKITVFISGIVMTNNRSKKPLFIQLLRALIETGFIIFLFYSNLLMGEFEKTGYGQKNGLLWALNDIFTTNNFTIAIVAAVIGYFVFEFLRKKI
jgi:hypothetical protein